MDLKELFTPILQKDEEIIKTYKPNKARYIAVSGCVASFFYLIGAVLSGILAFFGLTGQILDENNVPDKAVGIVGVVFAGIMILACVLTWVAITVEYRKVVYAYTNKRILIRRGFIGTDYATLDFDMIGGLMVNVGLFDKFIKKNGGTGTIRFGSAASPVFNASQGVTTPFMFIHINDPYGTYREIKEVIDASKNK